MKAQKIKNTNVKNIGSLKQDHQHVRNQSQRVEGPHVSSIHLMAQI